MDEASAVDRAISLLALNQWVTVGDVEVKIALLDEMSTFTQ